MNNCHDNCMGAACPSICHIAIGGGGGGTGVPWYLIIDFFGSDICFFMPDIFLRMRDTDRSISDIWFFGWSDIWFLHIVLSQQAQLRWIHVESTSWPDVVSTLIFGSIWKLNQRLVFHVDSTSFFPLWFHVFSTLNPRVFNVESTWCFPRWINVRTPRGFHVDIWFYMKVDSMSSFQRWIYVMFSTLNPHNIFN